jgi:hypothetical protein
MSARFPAGLTVAGFFLIAAIAAIDAGNWGLAGPLLGAWATVVGLTFAPKLPLLHRLPLLGAPSVHVEVRLFGGAQLDVAVPTKRERPRSVIVEVAVINRSRAPLREALVTVLLPYGIREGRCSYLGESVSDSGAWLPPIGHRLGGHERADRWSGEHEMLAADRELPLWFKVDLVEPGEYPVQVRVTSRDLYGGIYVSPDSIICVRETTADLPLVDRISELIDKGEYVRDAVPDVFTGGPLEMEFGAWIVETTMALPDEYADGIRDAAPKWTRREVGDDFRVAQINAKLKALYELRHGLSRGELT